MQPKPKPYPGTNKDIELIATRLRDRVINGDDRRTATARMLKQLVERTGGTIEVAEDPSDLEVDGGSLIINGPRDYKIFLSPFTTPLRDNFTIAHEVGHYVLHFFWSEPRPATPLRFARYGTDPIEWQANRFAAALLMPEKEFNEAYDRFDGDLMLLSGFFRVSLPAVEVRAKSLGLISEPAEAR